jgi:acetyl esterase/lipase
MRKILLNKNRINNMTKKATKCEVQFLKKAVFTVLAILALCAGTSAAMASPAVESQINTGGTRAVSSPAADPRIMRVFTVNLSNENVTLTCYLIGRSLKFRNALSRPGIIVMPGGGFTGLADREGEPVALAWLAEGYNAFVLRYTVGNPNDVVRTKAKALTDAEEALELIHQNAVEWHTDPDRIACVGFSAGGFVTAALGTRGRVKPNALILGYPYLQGEDSQGRQHTDIDIDVTSTTPPAFIFSTSEDSLLPHSLSFASAMQKAGVHFELHVFQEGQHGLSLGRSFTAEGEENLVNPIFAQWFSMCADWLRKIWGDFKTGDEFMASWPEYALHNLGVINTPISYLVQRPALWAAILAKAPFLEPLPDNPDVANLTITILSRHIPLLTEELMIEIEVAAKGTF